LLVTRPQPVIRFRQLTAHDGDDKRSEPEQAVQSVHDHVRFEARELSEALHILGHVLVRHEKRRLDRIDQDEESAAASGHRVVGEKYAAYDEGSEDDDHLDDVDSAPEALDLCKYRPEEGHYDVRSVGSFSEKKNDGG
jgi:hypothetical protein